MWNRYWRYRKSGGIIYFYVLLNSALDGDECGITPPKMPMLLTHDDMVETQRILNGFDKGIVSYPCRELTHEQSVF